MEMSPYLSFKGDCEEAFHFYEGCLNARIVSLHRYGGSPMAEAAPAGWDEKIMHGTLQIGERELLGSDVAPESYAAPSGFSLTLQFAETTAAEDVWVSLAEGGRVLVPLAPTFWAARFGMVVDRFGVPWMINSGGTAA